MSTRTMLDRYQTGVGYLARIINRLSGLLITIYMLVYIWEMGWIVRSGVTSFDSTMSAYHTSFWMLTHVLVVTLVVLHALGGLRVMLFESGVGMKVQKALFWLSLVTSMALFVVLFIHMINRLTA